TNFFDQSKAELRRNQFGYAVGGPFWRNKLFWFTDYQGTRQTVGASTGFVTLPTQDQRDGIFSTEAFVDSGTGDPMTVKRAYWARVLPARLGYTVTDGEKYGALGSAGNIQPCGSTSQCVFPGGVIPQSAFAAPAIGILPYIPLPNVDPA